MSVVKLSHDHCSPIYLKSTGLIFSCNATKMARQAGAPPSSGQLDLVSDWLVIAKL